MQEGATAILEFADNVTDLSQELDQNRNKPPTYSMRRRASSARWARSLYAQHIPTYESLEAGIR